MKNIDVNVSSLSINPDSNSSININFDIRDDDLLDLLDEMDDNDIISYLEDKGYDIRLTEI